MAKRAPSFDSLEHEYQELWRTMEIRPERMAAVNATASRIIEQRPRYEDIEAETGVPWFLVGIIHAMECGLRFDRHLHNGDPLTDCTVQVPAGRPQSGEPPFTWEESACDALLMKGLDGIASWTVARIAYELERYNGFGYRLHHPATLSPYLWSFSNHYTRGKYVADGKWSDSAVSAQSGAMAILRRIAELEYDVRLDTGDVDPARNFTRTPEVAEQPASMLRSTTGRASELVIATSSVPVFTQPAQVTQKLIASGKPWTVLDFVLALMADGTFVLGVLGVLGGVYIWAERARKNS